jgi:hypothetical protein
MRRIALGLAIATIARHGHHLRESIRGPVDLCLAFTLLVRPFNEFSLSYGRHQESTSRQLRFQELASERSQPAFVEQFF